MRAVADLPECPAGLEFIVAPIGSSVRAPDDDAVLEPGARHEGLLAWARSRYTAHGVLGVAALDGMRGYNARACQPPLEDAEVERLWRHLEGTRIAKSERAKTVTPTEAQAIATTEVVSASGPLTIRASDVASRSIAWLWPGRLAMSYLTVCTGVESVGKSVFWCWAIAALTCGSLEGGPKDPADVLILAGEDGIEDTWKPRLALAEANLNRCHFVRLEALAEDWNLRDGIDRLRDAIADTDARLLLIDAVMDHLPDARGGDGVNSPTYVRRAIGPLRALLREHQLAGVVSMHPPKGRASSEFRDMVQNSQAWTAVSRLGLLFAYHPDDAELPDDDRRRVVLRGKANIGRNPGALGFRVVAKRYVHDDGTVEQREVVVDVEPVKIGMRDLARAAEAEHPTTKVGTAAALMRAALRDGEWHPSADLFALLEAVDCAAPKTVAEAKKLVGVRTKKFEFDGGWKWALKAPPSPKVILPRAREECFQEEFFDVKKGDSSPVYAGSDEESPVLNGGPNKDPENTPRLSPETPRAHASARDGEGDALP